MKICKWGYFWCFLLTVCYGSDSLELLDLLGSYSKATVQFTQISEQATFEGRIGFDRPDIFYLERFNPSYYLLKMENSKMIIYDAELKQVIRQSATQEFIPAQILVNPKKIFDYFDVKKEQKNDLLVFMLVPKNEEFNSIKLIFKNYELRELNFTDQFHQNIKIIFDHFQNYQSLNWQIPEGVDLIDDE